MSVLQRQTPSRCSKLLNTSLAASESIVNPTTSNPVATLYTKTTDQSHQGLRVAMLAQGP